MGMNRSNEQSYINDNNSRIVTFSLTDMTLLQPIPESGAAILMLARLGLMGFMARRRQAT
jgi:hypothetical protein